ncbi:unnamed protein product, partial [Ascophyllum nodosum]
MRVTLWPLCECGLWDGSPSRNPFVRPTAVETALKMLKKVELATEGRTSSTLVMKANVVFGISDNDGEHKEGKSAKMWTGGIFDGSTWRTGFAPTVVPETPRCRRRVLRYLSNSMEA